MRVKVIKTIKGCKPMQEMQDSVIISEDNGEERERRGLEAANGLPASIRYPSRIRTEVLLLLLT